MSEICYSDTPDYRLLFDSAPDPMLILDTDLNIITVNTAYLNATMTRRDAILHRNIFDVFPDNPEDNEADGVSNLHASLKRVLASMEPDAMAVQRYDIRRPGDGSFEVRYWSPLNTPVLDQDGGLRYIIHRVTDATEYMTLKQASQLSEGLAKKAEEMQLEIYRRSQELQHARVILEQKNAELTRSYAEMESFSYSVSHDLRAPLRAVSGYAGIIAEDYSATMDAEANRMLGEIQKNSKKMGDLIDDLLALSKLGRKEIQKSEIDMTLLVRDALTEVTRDRGDRPDVIIGCLHKVVADQALMRHVVVNLLSNAIKYSSRTSCPHIEVSSDCTESEVIYTVRDNGVGFDMAYAHKLFAVFQRLHGPAEYEGTGVGLAIVKRVIERHAGRVWAEGKPNGGAIFSFSLPRNTEFEIS